MKKNAILSIKIDTKKPMELGETMRYLKAIENEYASYCKNKLKLAKKDRNLEIVKLKRGSWVIELMAAVVTSYPHGINPILGFEEYLTKALILFAGEKVFGKHSPQKYTTQNHRNLNIILGNGNNIIINNNNISSELRSVGGTKESSGPARKMAHESLIMSCRPKQLKEKISTKHKGAVLRWISDSFSKLETNKISDEGIIEKLDKEAHNIIFENAADKENILKLNARFDEGWKDLSYRVDVEVIRKQSKIKAYKILRVLYAQAIPK